MLYKENTSHSLARRNCLTDILYHQQITFKNRMIVRVHIERKNVYHLVKIITYLNGLRKKHLGLWRSGQHSEEGNAGNGIPCWPHRKIKSLDSLIHHLEGKEYKSHNITEDPKREYKFREKE